MTNHSTRTLNWPACYNIRDLGGLLTVDGGVTRWRALIRADIPARLTPEGQQALLDYGVRTILDLRDPEQVNEAPSIFMVPNNDFKTPTYLNLPLETREPMVVALMSAAKARAEVYQIILEHYPAQVAKIMRAINAAREGGVLIHCHVGKDRTGIVSALLLRLASVPDEWIAADYAESQVHLWPLYEKLIKEVKNNSDNMGQWLKQVVAEAGGDFNQVCKWLKPTATPETIHAMFAHIDARYGGVREYLLTTGLTAEELVQLGSRLRA